ncbi:mechanosensitive ion channel family protein [Thermosulfurimonas sp. F29]|uniref:mechanosensitive ion channel family protein n=1 Tax=Thermosulfurimonas sp. F29 TaxID=2867247 RepID=UPI001C82BB3E|nr:mechanosensitive ion channel family protein [Thermosulfurimonas sp. F29]MBX6422438.1 mechanosensitive ion channel family protein [Thermosulfurimonas sp. F29]
MKNLPPEALLLGKVAFLLAASWLAYWLTRRTLIVFIQRLAERSRTDIDDLLVQHGVFSALAYLVPLSVLYYGSLFVPQVRAPVVKAVEILLAPVAALIVNRGLSVALALYNRLPFARRHPIRGYVQILKFLVWLAAGIVAVCTLLDRSPWGILSGLGALSAVVILVFRNTILSFVASVQIISQDLIRIGDWIEAPQFGADGEVVEMTLYNVLVQNWDKTIVSIPTYRLMEESFKNWRGMERSGGRRIKRHLLVDQSSVKFVDDELLERLRRIHLLRDYLDRKLREIEDYNRRMGIDAGASPLNGRRLTNLGTFRVYVEEYLRAHPMIRKDMTLMVRHLQPTAEGLPLEVYCFVADTRWVPYEKVQADIFDHIIAAAPEFELRIFQKPTGFDLKEALSGKCSTKKYSEN